MVTGSFRGCKAEGAWRWPPTPSSAEVKERVELIPVLEDLGLDGKDNIMMGSQEIGRECKSKSKVNPRTNHEGPEGKYRYSSTLSLTSSLDGGWSAPHPGRFTPGKDPDQFYRMLGGRQGRSGRMRKISLPPGFDPRTFQPGSSRCTDYALPAPGVGGRGLDLCASE